MPATQGDTVAERALGAGLVALVALATLRFGLEGETLRATVVLASGLLFAAHAHFSRHPPGLGWPGRLVAGALIGVGLLQLVPLPPSLITLLSPASGELYAAHNAANSSTTSPWQSASLEPLHSARVLLSCLACVLVFCVARARAARDVVLPLVVLGAIVALCALGGLATQGDQSDWARRARWPFVNPNHFASYLVLTLGLGVGFVLSRAPGGQRAIAGAALAFCVIALVATRSRGGVLAAGVGAGAALALSALGSRRRGLAALGAVVALVLGLALSDREPLRERFATQAPVRAGMSLGARGESWNLAWTISKSAPLAGTGLGTFDTASAQHLDPEQRRWTRPAAAHNDALELAAGLGWPAALVVLFGLGLALAQGTRRALSAQGTTRALTAGAIGAACGVIAHSLLDFPLHVPAVATLFAASLGLALSRSPGEAASPTSSGSPRWRRWTKHLGVVFGALVVLAGAAWTWQAHQNSTARTAYDKISGVRRELRTAQAARSLKLVASALGPLARGDAYARHAQTLLALPEPDTAAALESTREALRRAPGEGRLHLLLASLLLQDPSPLTPERRAEVEARTRLGVRCSPTYPQVLRQAVLVALDLRVRTGDEAALELAQDWLRRLILQRPGDAPQWHKLLGELKPQLGRAAEQLQARIKDWQTP